MKFNQSAILPVGSEPLWQFLMDIPKVSGCLPGVESVEKTDEGTDTYQGTLKVRVGPISLTLLRLLACCSKTLIGCRQKEDRRCSYRHG